MSVKIVHLEQPRPREPGNSRADYVGEMIREAIRDGHYKPGEHIPETDVASWLAVSRTPVRKALRRLEAEGLLTFASWRGAVVAELDRQQVSELYAMREVLEAAAARLAAQQIGNVELDILGDLHAKSTSALADPKTWPRSISSSTAQSTTPPIIAIWLKRSPVCATLWRCCAAPLCLTGQGPNGR